MGSVKSLLNYDELCKVVDTELPFRGRKQKEYPLRHRRDGRRHFTVEGEGKDRSFRIYNGLDWDRITLTREEYAAKTAANESRLYSSGNAEYFQWVASPSELCVVSGDGLTTITAKRMGQGNRLLLDYCLVERYYGSFSSSAGHGGVIYRNLRKTKMFPICVGMRINFNDMTLDPSSEYELIGRRVNRKKSKELHRQCEGFFKLTKAMMSSIPELVFAQMCDELIKEHHLTDGKTNSFWQIQNKLEQIKALGFSFMESSPLDAAALFCIAYDVRGWCRKISYGFHSLKDDRNVDYLYDQMCRRIWEDTYRRNQQDVMDSKSFEVGKPVPRSLWKYEFYQDGELLPQYVA
jgi:hypothetical protein